MINPYNTKIKKAYALKNPNISDIPDDPNVIEDFKIKPLKKFYRPSFSPYTNSWIVDIGFIEGSLTFGYLFFINENTRFLFCWPTIGKSTNAIAIGFNEFLKHFGNRPCRIKGDGEKGFAALADRLSGKTHLFSNDSKILIEICSNPTYRRNVKFWLKKNNMAHHLTNSYCIVDSIIRVMRNLLRDKFSDRNAFFAMVRIYNNTVHSAFQNKFTPMEMQSNFEKEMAFIRMKERELEKTKWLQTFEGNLTHYEPGNIVLVHIPWEKTRKRFMKQRRNFSALATFIQYEGGNAMIKLLKSVIGLVSAKTETDLLVIPLYYTKFVAKSIDEIDEKYKSMIPYM
jgi:hypothetical protein